jgi:hypothetical protein
MVNVLCRGNQTDKLAFLRSPPPESSSDSVNLSPSFLRTKSTRCETPILFLGGWACWLILGSLVQVHGQQKCYFRSGQLDVNDIPCTNLTTLSDVDVPCCAPGRQCLENRICSNTTGDPDPSRGSCTDWSWQSGNCPQFCDSGMDVVPRRKKKPTNDK